VILISLMSHTDSLSSVHQYNIPYISWFDQKGPIARTGCINSFCSNLTTNSRMRMSQAEYYFLSDISFKENLNFDSLERHLGGLLMLFIWHYHKSIKWPVFKLSAMQWNVIHTEAWPEVHKLIRFYLTVPVTFSTPERAFSTLRHLLWQSKGSITVCYFTSIKT